MNKKLRLSTSTIICSKINWETEHYSSEDAIREIGKAGFEAVDLDLAFNKLSHDPMLEDNWKDWVERQIQAAAEYNMPITQGHAHFFSKMHCELLSEEEIMRRENIIKRDIEAAAMCGIKWLVIHPSTYCDDVYYSQKLSMKKNVEHCKRLGEVAAKHGVGIAIENLTVHKPPCFCASTDDLMELLDRLGDDKVFGICWDTGHGLLNEMDQPAAIRQIGKRLKALHINDNGGKWDEHILPFQGRVEWKPIMKALGEIGYENDVTFEVLNYSKGFDEVLHPAAIRFAKEVGDYLISLME